MRVIITGAAGRIGTEVVKELSGSHDLCLLDRIPVPGRASIIANLARSRCSTSWKPWRSRQPRWMEAFEGADAVLDLAVDWRDETAWHRLLPENIQTTWNVIEAAVRHRVPRFVYASSNWAVKALERELAPDCYMPHGRKIDSNAAPRPIRAYGVCKALGEIMGRMAVDEGRLRSFVAVRIGSYDALPPDNEDQRQRWIGVQDMRSLLRRCLEAQFEGFHLVYGVSAQPAAPYDLSYTRRLLSWEPKQLPQVRPA